jgi:hypothetical protein
MREPYTGGCACGAIRYAAAAEPVFQNHCQCSDCRRRAGTGHGSYLTFASRAAVTITGVASEWRVRGDSGAEKTHAFCPACGAPVYLTFAAAPDAIAFHAGSLDDPARFTPAVVTYAARRLPWDSMDPALRTFETMPSG